MYPPYLSHIVLEIREDHVNENYKIILIVYMQGCHPVDFSLFYKEKIKGRFFKCLSFSWGFPGGSVVKNSPAKQEMQV